MSPEHCISAPICWCVALKAAATTKIQKISDYSYVNKIMKNSRESERISQFICLVRIFAFRYPAGKFSTGGIKNRTREKKLLGVSWPYLVFRPCNVTVMGSQCLKGLQTGKCLAFCDFFYTWQSCCIVALMFLSLLNSYLFFKMGVHPRRRASIDFRLNDVRQLRLILSSYF